MVRGGVLDPYPLRRGEGGSATEAEGMATRYPRCRRQVDDDADKRGHGISEERRRGNGRGLCQLGRVAVSAHGRNEKGEEGRRARARLMGSAHAGGEEGGGGPQSWARRSERERIEPEHSFLI